MPKKMGYPSKKSTPYGKKSMPYGGKKGTSKTKR